MPIEPAEEEGESKHLVSLSLVIHNKSGSETMCTSWSSRIHEAVFGVFKAQV